MVKIAHIVNPVNAPSSSDLYRAQPITFESMRIAQRFGAEKTNVKLFSSEFADDATEAPRGFICTPALKKSVLDYRKFRLKRKLPLLKDVLGRLYETATDSNYLIYSNVDIALMPFFYEFVSKKVKDGYDGIIINRRTISDRYSFPEELPVMSAEIGKIHIGWDCFVFKRDIFPNFILGDVCIGAPYMGLLLKTNIQLFSKSFREFKNRHLTFHLGEEKGWEKAEFSDYTEFNRDMTLKCLQKLEEKFPEVELVIHKYFVDKPSVATRGILFLKKITNRKRYNFLKNI